VRRTEVGDSAAEVAPTASRGVGRADDGLGELLGAPDLACDEGGEPDADDRPARDEADRIGYEKHRDEAKQAEEENPGKALAGSKFITHHAHEEATDDICSDRCDVAKLELCAGEAESGRLLEDGRQRCGRESGEEGGEESEPRRVEGCTSGTQASQIGATCRLWVLCALQTRACS
jgi:hypothetical protein